MRQNPAFVLTLFTIAMASAVSGCTSRNNQQPGQESATAFPATQRINPQARLQGNQPGNAPQKPQQAGQAANPKQGEAGAPQAAPPLITIPGQGAAETFGSAVGRS